jgi:hypothetical protein
LEYGNYTEDKIVNSIVNLTKEGKLLKAKRKRNQENVGNGLSKNRLKKNLSDIQDKEDSLESKSLKIKGSQISISDNRANNLSLKEQNDDNLSMGKSEFDQNVINSFSGSGMNTFNDESFEKIIKEFLNINYFPTESKEKINLLKKFISIYKKIKDDKNKLGNFIKKISEKLREPYQDIEVIKK